MSAPRKLGLAFSTGKDSLACLLLHRDQLHEITVFYVDTGKAYPESLAMLDWVRSVAPRVVIVCSDRVRQNETHGIPADVVPINWTTLGQTFTGPKPCKVQSYLQCCYENISRPLHDAAHAHGITHLIRGQRLEEGHRSTARDGDVVEGITYLQPIERWTKGEVLAFIGEHMEVPAHYAIGHSSLDCYDCTAYAKESRDRIEYTRERHPELYARYAARRDALHGALIQSLSGIERWAP